MALRMMMLSRLLRGASPLPVVCAMVPCNSAVSSNSIMVVRFMVLVLNPSAFGTSPKTGEEFKK
jgi:hypothetical protein